MTHKTRGLAIVSAAYVIALGAGALTLAFLDTTPLIAIGAATSVATLALYAIGMAFKNASFYDAYWSVFPMAITPWMVLQPEAIDGSPLRQALIVGVIWLWGARLTWNWAHGWTGLEHEDWRYTKLRDDNPRLYPLINFAGIHLFPTALVFGGLCAAWAAIEDPAPFGLIDAIAAALGVTAVAIEAIADQQLRDFKASNTDPKAFIKDGLWAWSRHPNYFGEQLLWWSLGLFAIGASLDNAWTLFGPLTITCLFTFISIPLMEARMVAKRPAYREHQRRTSACFPWPPRDH